MSQFDSSLRDGRLSLTEIFVVAFAALCIFLSGLAVFRLWKATDFPSRTLWIVGSLAGFVGFAVEPKMQSDLLLTFGVQLPLVQGTWSSAEGLRLKAFFPILAVIALLKIKDSEVAE